MNETPESREDLLWKALCQSQRLDLTGEITGGMVHDLNNSLSIVNGLVELLQEKLSADVEAGSDPSLPAAQLLDLARRDLPRILTWMEASMAGAHRLLDHAYRLREEDGEVDVNALCAAAVDESRYRCERQGIQVALDLADDLPAVDGRPGQLMQILTNVLRNCREAYADADAGPARVIYLSTRHNAGRVIVHIDDDGPGLPTGVGDDEIFELAYSTKRDAVVGAGLPVARAIARGHGGDLRLGERVAGTRMVLELPAAG